MLPHERSSGGVCGWLISVGPARLHSRLITGDGHTARSSFFSGFFLVGARWAAIFNVACLKSTEINAMTFKGVVKISGFVNSAADIQRAVASKRELALGAFDVVLPRLALQSNDLAAIPSLHAMPCSTRSTLYDGTAGGAGPVTGS